MEYHYLFYTPLHIVGDEAVKQAGWKLSNAGQSVFRMTF
jgi:hypothetical protein